MEQVVLLSDAGTPIGVAPKHEVHTHETPLHLAFSCYVFRADGALLVTRRALSKRTWPGVWTNSFCGHPAPGEPMDEAVARRGLHELGAPVRDIRTILPDFRYRAVDADGIVENELCPVHVATLDGELSPDPREVGEWAWTRLDDLAAAIALTPFAFSPWLVGQVPLLREAPLLRDEETR